MENLKRSVPVRFVLGLVRDPSVEYAFSGVVSGIEGVPPSIPGRLAAGIVLGIAPVGASARRYRDS